MLLTRSNLCFISPSPFSKYGVHQDTVYTLCILQYQDTHCIFVFIQHRKISRMSTRSSQRCPSSGSRRRTRLSGATSTARTSTASTTRISCLIMLSVRDFLSRNFLSILSPVKVWRKLKGKQKSRTSFQLPLPPHFSFLIPLLFNLGSLSIDGRSLTPTKIATVYSVSNTRFIVTTVNTSSSWLFSFSFL